MEEIINQLTKMKGNKASGPVLIPIEGWKMMGEQGIAFLEKVLNEAITSGIPSSWRLKPQSHQAYDQDTTYLRPKYGAIVDRKYDLSQRSYDWSQRSWVIARGKSAGARSCSCFLFYNLYNVLVKRITPVYFYLTLYIVSSFTVFNINY